MKRRALTSTFACACLAALALLPPSAQASFPGRNGKLAFHTNRDAGNWEIYTMNPNGSSPLRLTNVAGQDLEPAWSPDGRKIAFTSEREAQFDVYTMNADGSNQTRLTTDSAADVAPGWSADGTKIVFSTNRDGNGEVYTMNANGTNQVRITTNTADDGFAAWSPDGSQIAFQSIRDGNWEIYTMNTNGTGQTNRTNNPAYDEYPSWYPDSTRILFDSNRNDGFFQLYRMNADGTIVQRQTTAPGNDKKASAAPQINSAGAGGLAWMRDIGGDFEIVTSLFNPTGNSVDDGFPDWQPIVGTYARPISGTPYQVPLVPAYKECVPGSTDTSHRGHLGAASCYAPQPESSFLTVGSPDYNGQPANSSGSLRITVFCNGGASGETAPCLTTAGDQLDGKVVVTLTDVRCTGLSGGCSGGALSDYTGNLRAETNFRVTDKNNGPLGTGLSANGTLNDFLFTFNVPCSATAPTNVGATCSITTSIDAVFGGNTAVQEQKRAIWQLHSAGSDFRLYDGGPDGVAQTSDNTLFATSGLFFP